MCMCVYLRMCMYACELETGWPYGRLVFVYVCVYVCACMCVYVCVCMYVCIYMYVCVCVSMYVCVRVGLKQADHIQD